MVVDSMHNLFLGLIKQHFSHILGIHTNIQEEEDVAINITFADMWKSYIILVQKSIHSIMCFLSQ